MGRLSQICYLIGTLFSLSVSANLYAVDSTGVPTLALNSMKSMVEEVVPDTNQCQLASPIEQRKRVTIAEAYEHADQKASACSADFPLANAVQSYTGSTAGGVMETKVTSLYCCKPKIQYKQQA